MKTEVRAVIDAEIESIMISSELPPEQVEAFLLAPAHQKLLAVLDAMPDDYTTPIVYSVISGGIFRPIEFRCANELIELTLQFYDTRIVVLCTDLTVLPYQMAVSIVTDIDRDWIITNVPGLQIQPVVDPVDPEGAGAPVDPE